ncbi:MAG: class I SAM-dependent methyltransferase [Defluviitaleaceae bacterium]|nr:class I SAM-dependent methyltransferase [Defluviitaleaceae bacterium]
MENYRKTNAEVIDKWVENGWVWGIPATAADCEKARAGDWDVFLTPKKPVPKQWFEDIFNIHNEEGRTGENLQNQKNLLGLASGGGQQMPIFAVLGAKCTVMDLSDKQLESEKLVAAREGYSIDIVKADMTEKFPFADNYFNMIFHPVANCYIEDVYHLWRECYRVLKPGGVLLAGFDNGLNYLFDDDTTETPVITGKLPYNPLKNPSQMAKLNVPEDGVQFSHTFDEQIGGQLKAGFVIVDAYEDYNHDPLGKEISTMTKWGIPAFWATRAVKLDRKIN